MKRIVVSLILLLMVACALPQLASAQQGLPVDGKDFYIGYVYPSFNKNPNNASGRNVSGFYNVYALISSYEPNNQVTIAYFDPQSGKEVPSIVKFVTAHNAIEIPLDQVAMRCSDTGDIPEYRSCHITAKKPVNVQYFSTGACSGGSYLAIPTAALGKNYVIPSQTDNPGYGAATNSGSQGENAGGFFQIISAFDNTIVQIIPNGLTAGKHIGTNTGIGSNGSPRPYTVTLARGQVYFVKGDGSDDGNDMSGTVLTGSKPFGVLAGHEDAFIGDVGARYLDARDYMIEQIIPAEYWDSTGYVSMPLKDPVGVAPEESGAGENYRVFTSDPRGAQADMWIGTNAYPMFTSKYSYPLPEKDNITDAVEFRSENGGKFGVMMYDNRAQGSAPPYPAESMMSIVPMSRWRTSYLFDVPANAFVVLQSYYVNLIALRNDIDRFNIKYSLNGGALTPLSALPAKGNYTNFPHHPELKGVRYSVQPGAYYFTNTRDAIKHPFKEFDSTGSYQATPEQVAADTGYLHGGFMMYHYGYRALDPDRDLGDFCGDDFFFSYALPIGMTVSSGKGNPKITVDTLCSSWHVCIHDTIGIRSIQLLDDPGGNYDRPGKQFYNARFDPALDPDNKGEIDFTGDDTVVCVDIFASNPLDSAYAPLYIVDVGGTHIAPVPELHYKAAQVRLSKLPDLPAKIDTLIFPPMEIKNEVCSTLVYINTAGKTGKSIVVTKAALQQNAGSITLDQSTIVPPLPATLKPGDTLKITICFKPQDTLVYKDSIILTTDCFNAPLPIIGSGGTPLIIATDIDFGDVNVGTTSRKPLTVRNVGTVDFKLTQNWLLHNTTVFAMDPTSAALLPATLSAGGKAITLYFLYTPKAVGPEDSTTVDWNTDIPAPYTQQIKSWSYLKGHPIKPGVVWDRLTQLDSVICDDSVIVRVNLLNNSGTDAQVNQVFFEGPDASEYQIVADQLGKIPMANFPMKDKDILWVDVKFKADLTKTGAAKYADRHATIVAKYSNPASHEDDSTIIDFTGKVQHANLVITPQLLSYGFIGLGLPASGTDTIINNGDAPFVLGSLLMTYPVTGVLLNGVQLKPGDIIGVGDTVILDVTVQLDSFGHAIGAITYNGTTPCSMGSQQAEADASSRQVLTTGFPAPKTFVTCREHDSTVTFTNLGFAPVTLQKVEIVSTPGNTNTAEFDLKDPTTGNLTPSVTFTNKVVSLNQSVTVQIVYHPNIVGPVSATIQYTYDSSGKIFTLTQPATGIGVHLQTTLSVERPGKAPYTAEVGAPFDVPVSLATTPLIAEGDAMRVTFTLTYVRDVVDLMGTPVANTARGYKLNTAPAIHHFANGDESIDFDVSRDKPMDSLDEIIRPTYRVMVAQQLTSPFVVSNITFFDSKNAPICYISADTLPSVFIPGYLCGDTSLHKYLLGVLPTRISMVTPNVITQNETPVLFYSINRSDLPVKVEIYDVLGQKVRTVQDLPSEHSGDYKVPIGVATLPSGTYTVRLTTPLSSETANFIIQK